MPKVISYTPPWLCRPSPGARIFSNPEPQSPVSPSKRTSYFNAVNASPTKVEGPRKLVATRGSEIFTVVGNKIRWADLARVKDDWTERRHGREHTDEPEVYRTLTTPVYYQITQLIVSPSGTFLAICTAHTVHIAVLPDNSRLAESDRSPIKLKSYQLGPTTHVIPESPLVSVLWHPLAASSDSTDCLITVTAEAAVRVWELDRANQWSFERAALSIDLRKLADGVSCDQDFEPSGFGKSRGFSVDAFDMEATAACFGGTGATDEDGWASMTLWIAMTNGDVYALCPLLPSRWRPTATTIPSLSVSAVSKVSSLDSQQDDADERKATEQQYEWLQQIDQDEPSRYLALIDEIRQRPQYPSAIPRLQGPFEIGIDELGGGEVADLHVIAARLDEDLLLSGEDDFEIVSEGLQFTTVCLSTTSNVIYMAIELEGVSGQWLPKKGRGTFSVPDTDSRDLVLLDTVNLSAGAQQVPNVWPIFTTDTQDAYGFYVTSGDRVHSLSINDWATRVGFEVDGEGEVDTGLRTRLTVACQNQICVSQEVFKLDTALDDKAVSALSAPGIINDFMLGHMLLSCSAGQACAVLFDQTKLTQSTISIGQETSPSPFRSSLALAKALEDDIPDPIPIRAPYAPASVFDVNQMTPYSEMRNKLPASRRSVLTEKPLRLSPACLDIMTFAHRTFSQQTSSIEKAAAELFGRCERLRVELADQVKQMGQLADRLQHINADSQSSGDTKISFDERLLAAQNRQQELIRRYEALRRKSGRVGTANRELSSREQAWIEEIETLAKKVSIDDDKNSDSLSGRYNTIQSLAPQLIAESKQIIKNSASPQPEGHRRNQSSLGSPNPSMSSRIQRERVAEVMAMVEREGAIIDAAISRLRDLSTV